MNDHDQLADEPDREHCSPTATSSELRISAGRSASGTSSIARCTTTTASPSRAYRRGGCAGRPEKPQRATSEPRQEEHRQDIDEAVHVVAWRLDPSSRIPLHLRHVDLDDLEAGPGRETSSCPRARARSRTRNSAHGAAPNHSADDGAP
jgi:hypothetical protein